MTTEITAAGVMPAGLVVRPAPGARTTVAATTTPSAEPARPREVEPTAPTDPPKASGTALCRCGHDAEAHEHYRPGSDCGACGAALCGRFRAPGRRRWLRLRRRG